MSAFNFNDDVVWNAIDYMRDYMRGGHTTNFKPQNIADAIDYGIEVVVEQNPNLTTESFSREYIEYQMRQWWEYTSRRILKNAV